MMHCVDSAARKLLDRMPGCDVGHRLILLDSTLLNLSMKMTGQLGIAKSSRCKGGGNASKKNSTTKRSYLADESGLNHDRLRAISHRIHS